MRRPQEIRAAPRGWVPVLQVAYSFLRKERSVGDLVLFGSQALSMYVKNPLRSKDLDLLSAQVGPSHMEALADRLSHLKNVELRATTVQTRRFDHERMTTYAIELRLDGKPFFVELFDRILNGQPLSVLHPYLTARKRWGLELWVPTCEAILALRLAFRQPEGISRLNAIRLNRFIQENKRKLDFELVALIVREWKVEALVEQNLFSLYRRNKLRIFNDRKIIPGIETKLKHPLP